MSITTCRYMKHDAFESISGSDDMPHIRYANYVDFDAVLVVRGESDKQETGMGRVDSDGDPHHYTSVVVREAGPQVRSDRDRGCFDFVARLGSTELHTVPKVGQTQMKALELATIFYSLRPMYNFWHDVEWHIKHGYLYASPRCIIMASIQEDAWHVHFACGAGYVKRFLELMPVYKPIITFARPERGRPDANAYSTDRLLRYYGINRSHDSECGSDDVRGRSTESSSTAETSNRG